MLLTRIVVLIFAIVLVACGVCAALFPLMRKKGLMIEGHASEKKVYLWYEEIHYKDGLADHYHRTYHRNSKCDGFKTAAVTGAAIHVAACGLGGIICLLAAAHIYARKKFNICCSIMIFCFVAFACFAVSVATVVFVFCADTCVNDNATRVVALRHQGYIFVEGFMLLCVSAFGFLIAMFLEVCS
ncbi:hypothetical protein conserved [Leishmania donovani]|uniref:Hypothetical_protein_conserved n=1 Tax=Leishmania donovani TaxID=5661 RepID=A0A3S7WTU4_LEIDO|nr:hypothetical protein LdCL_160009700 [Leishmania donovani]TPP40942.1 hypothetical protein CGC20_36465 [Leishmania donovani]CAJ1987634.1 hypothetical protein conserved [Leishmania donovani]VDZ43522.1 hypothetical_protein_conserved [Leishmania donovani]